jgi:hypothetical protein
VATDANGCEVEAAIFDVTAGIQSLSGEDASIRVYPNPVGDKLIVAGNASIVPDEISIYNMPGEKIFISNENRNKKDRKVGMNLRDLAPGIYYLTVRSSGKTFRTKFIKR